MTYCTAVSKSDHESAVSMTLRWIGIFSGTTMEGFDDLLAPSRSALEDNPFADPFAKRSNSPDPWATPFANNSVDDYSQDTTPISDTHGVAANPHQSSSITATEIPAQEPPNHLWRLRRMSTMPTARPSRQGLEKASQLPFRKSQLSGP